MLTFVTRSGNDIVLTYDALNRVWTKAPTGEATATYTYDLANRKLSSSTPIVSGNPATGTFSFFYDTAGRFYKESTPDSKTTTLGLDNNGNVTQLTYPDTYYVTRVYDQLNRLTNLKLNGATSSAVQISYDELSRRQTVTLGNGVVTNYSFAINNDLVALSHAFVGSSVIFTYGFNNVHQEISLGASDPSYTWHPSATSTTSYGTASSVNAYPSVGGTSYSYDGNANLSGNGTWTFTYDTESHLISASETGTSVSYVYDADHRQIEKTVGSTNSYYVYSNWQRIADYAGSGSGALQNRYIHSDALDEPLIAVTGSGTVTYLHADRTGSIIAVTNSSGAVVDKNTYSSYGENAPSGTTFGFTGQRYDSDSGLYYCKARYYSPTIGRFLQTDPVGYDEGLNLYTYGRNDPLNRRDSLGLSSDSGANTAAANQNMVQSFIDGLSAAALWAMNPANVPQPGSVYDNGTISYATVTYQPPSFQELVAWSPSPLGMVIAAAAPGSWDAFWITIIPPLITETIAILAPITAPNIPGFPNIMPGLDPPSTGYGHWVPKWPGGSTPQQPPKSPPGTINVPIGPPKPPPPTPPIYVPLPGSDPHNPPPPPP